MKGTDHFKRTIQMYLEQRAEEDTLFANGKSSVSCPLKPSDSAPLKHSTMPP